MDVSGAELKKFNDALGKAFTPDTFERMLEYHAERRLQDYASKSDPMPTITFEVSTAARGEGWLVDLIDAARQALPRNEVFAAMAAQIGVSSLAPELEARIRQDLRYLDIASFLASLTAIESQVCKVEVAAGPSGTGFLLGPDVMMTNHHVLAPVIAGTREPRHVSVRFDYRKASDGSELPGKTVALAASGAWLLDASPPLPSPGAAPTANDRGLDYAVVRLDEPSGRDQVRLAGDGAGLERGWVAMPDPVPELAADAPLAIVQHPEGGALKLAMETQSVIGLTENGVRLRHRTNTEPGSSGSPCFNDAWALVALHCAGQNAAHPDWNEAVPMTEIRSQLEARNTLELLGVD